MGFYVTTLRNLPVGPIRWFIHVIDASSNGVHSRWLKEDLPTFGALLGQDAGLVAGPIELSQELLDFLQRNLALDEFRAVQDLLHNATCLLISEGHLSNTHRPVYLIPVATREDSDSERPSVRTLVQTIAEALRTGVPLQDKVSRLGTHELQLKTTGGVFVCNLRRINEVVELKPNIAGLGVNLNAIIERFVAAVGTRVL